MKKWFAIFVAVVWPVLGFSDEIKVRGEKWDDLSQALGIIPFYIEIQSPVTARSLNLSLEIYQEGKLVRTLYNTGLIGQKSVPIDLKSSLFFRPTENESEYRVTWTTLASGSIGKGSDVVSKSILDFSGFAFSTVAKTIGVEKKTLLAIILCHKGRASMADTLNATIAANEGATVAGLYLEHE